MAAGVRPAAWRSAFPLLALCFFGVACYGNADDSACSLGGALVAREKGADTKGPSCMKLFLQSKGDTAKCKGVVDGMPMGVEGNWKQFEVRAVKYVPRPIGLPSTADVYTVSYKYIYDRDLKAIADVTRANTVTLAPWDSSADHSDFLAACRKNGLHVIPTFDFKAYVKPKFQATDGDLRQQLGQDFEEFLGEVEEVPNSPIIAWALNYGLSLHDVVKNGKMSDMNTGNDLENYFSLLCYLRHVHRNKEYNETLQAYTRPLAIPLDLNSAKSAAEIGWYVGFVESRWGNWPDCPFWENSPSNFGEHLGALRRHGSFDIWLAHGLYLADDRYVDKALAAISALNATLNATLKDTGSGVQWPNTQERSETDAIGKPFPDCKEGGCPPITQKAVIIQFGFSSRITKMDKGSLIHLETSPTNQMRKLQMFWGSLKAKTDGKGSDDIKTCASGGILDEWNDDWDRNADYGCKSSPYRHGVDEVCAEVFDQGQVYPEWFGINAQYSLYGLQCIEPRTDVNGSWFCFADENGEVPEKPCPVRLDPSQWSPVMMGVRFLVKCRAFAVPIYIGQKVVPVGPAIIFWVLCMLIFPVGRCIRVKCCLTKPADGGDLSEDENAKGDLSFSGTLRSASNPDLMDSTMTVTKSMTQPAAQTAAGTAPPVELNSESFEVLVPRVFHDVQHPQYSKFLLELKYARKRKGKSGMQAFSKDFAKLFLESHSRVQARRLWQQIEAEAWALQSPKRGELEEEASFKAAMSNVHARVLEGYLVWLEKTSKAQRSEKNKKSFSELLKTNHEEAGCRSVALQYMDALVLRVIESLAEQALHSPEFVAYYFHRARFPDGQDDRDEEADKMLKFPIDYEALHAGIEMMCENANPYRGGINFDDINDCALDNPDTLRLRKTLHESPSILVLVDCFSNFEPVFTLKMWVFYVSWLLHHLFIGEGPAHQKFTATQIVMNLISVDASLLIFIEALSLLLGIRQGRCGWKFGRKLWIVRRFTSLINSGFGLFLYFKPSVLGSEGMACMVYWVLRIVLFLVLAIRMRSVPFLRGTPLANAGAAAPKPKIVKYRMLIWLFMLGMCMAFETFFVVPLSYGVHFDEFCQDACDLSPGHRMWLASSCISCMGAVSAIWFIVGLTAFFDIYYVFYLGTALVGYGQGHSLGLTNALQSAQRQIDLTSERRKESHDVKEYSNFTEARVLRKLFGPSWRMVWSRMAESLHEECMISSEDADTIVKCASTVRWEKRNAEVKRMVLPEDRFKELRFTPTARRVAELDKEDLGESSAAVAATRTEMGPCISCMVMKRHPADLELLRVMCDRADIAANNGSITAVLSEAISVCEFFYETSKDSDAEDPTQWKLEGRVADGSGDWKELFVQSATYVPSTVRGVREGPFGIDFWRLQGSKDGKLSLDKIEGEGAVERITFFVSSLHHLSKNDKETLFNAHHGTVPSLTQILPCYDETVINAEKMLRESDGVNTNLAFIISQYVYEWKVFCDRMRWPVDRLYEDFIQGGVLTDDVIMEVRMWAAMRSQTVARTVVGAMQYHEVLSLIPSVTPNTPDRKGGMGTTSVRHGSLGQLILAHQTFGAKKGKPENDAAVIYLLERYQKWPMFVVFDYDSKNSRDAIKNLVENAVRTLYPSAQQCRAGPRFASVMVRINSSYKSEGKKLDVIAYQDAIEVVEVIPRYYPLLIGTKNFMTQGKAGNQLGALRFAAGHFVQMMDANMGASFGEACKVPFVLRMFQPVGTDRKHVTCRILGFRELIFTKDHGAMGDIMASSEWSFGTICQRFLAGLDVRMHYGHPDFIDAFWGSNRGSLSKASPAINLSEDIFAGFNARMRGERSHHIDDLAWEKGREASFNASSLFFTKISKGNVGVMRSRDLKILTERLGIFDNLSFYFASIGFYLNNWLIDISLFAYVLLFVLLALASKDLNSIGTLGSMLAVEWVVSMGTIAMLPRLAELVLEYGYFEGIVKFFPSIPGIMLAFTFINKSIASGVSEAMFTGEAKYIATGRPNANTHYSWRECYLVHSSTHYYPALQVVVGFTIYTAISRQLGDASLPMLVILATAAAWIMAPIIFCPQPTFTSLARDATELWKFVVATPKRSIRRMVLHGPVEEALHTGINDAQSTLYEVWLLKALEHKRHSIKLQAATVFWDFMVLVILGGLVHSRVYNALWSLLKYFTGHCLLLEAWRIFGRPEILIFAAFIVVLPLPLAVTPSVEFANTLVAFVLLRIWMRFSEGLILFLARLCIRPDLEWASMPDKSEDQMDAKRKAARKDLSYNIVVEYFYVNFMSYELHLVKALVVLVVDFCTQAPMVLLDFVTGLHSQLLLNRNLGCVQGVCGTRRPYVPGERGAGKFAEPSTERVGVRASLRNIGQSLRRAGSSRASLSGSQLGTPLGVSLGTGLQQVEMPQYGVPGSATASCPEGSVRQIPAPPLP